MKKETVLLYLGIMRQAVEDGNCDLFMEAFENLRHHIDVKKQIYVKDKKIKIRLKD